MPETNIQDVANAEEQQPKTNPLNPTQQVAQEPVYNPLSGMSMRQFRQIVAGGNPDAPLFTTDAYGNPTFHPENVGKAKPAEVKVGSVGQIEVEGEKEAFLKNLDKFEESVNSIFTEVAPEFSKAYDKSSMFRQGWTMATYRIPERALHGATDMMINMGHAVLAQSRNFAELQWQTLAAEKKGTQEWQEAGAHIKALQDSGIEDNAMYMFDPEKANVSDEAKKILYQYKGLLEERHEDERRMRLAAIYSEQKPELGETRAGRMAAKIGAKERGGDQNTVVGMLGEMGGDILGSQAVFWTVGRLTGGIGGAAALAKNVKRFSKTVAAARAMGAKSAIRLGFKATPAIMATAARVGERAVFAPAFLNQYNSMRTQALLSGKTIDEANAIGFLGGIAEGGLEFAGFRIFHRLYSKGGHLRNFILRGMLPEALQEGSQTAAENLITETFGVTDKEFSDILYEIGMSIVAGGLGGAMFGSMTYRIDSMAAQREKILSDYERVTKALSREEKIKGAQLANARIEAKEASSKRPPKEPPTDGGAAAAQVSDEEKFNRLENQWLEEGAKQPLIESARERIEEAEKRGQSKEEALFEIVYNDLGGETAKPTYIKEIANLGISEQEAIQKWDNFVAREDARWAARYDEKINNAKKLEESASDNVKQAAKSYEELYNDLKQQYIEFCDAKGIKGTPKAKQQRDNGWAMIRYQMNAEIENQEISKAFSAIVDRTVAFIDSQNKVIKENAKNTQKLLIAKGYSKELAERLTSNDAIVQHEARWEEAERQFADEAMRNGIPEPEAKLMAQWMRSTWYYTTLTNPNVDVSKLVEASTKNMINVQVAVFHDQALPDMFRSPLSNIKRSPRTETARALKKRCYGLVGRIYGQSEEYSTETNQELYGDASYDPNLTRTQASLDQQAALMERVINRMQMKVSDKLSADDYRVMVLMKRMGATQNQINDAFGFKMRGEVSAQENFDEVAEKLFPSLDDEKLTALQNIDEQARQGSDDEVSVDYYSDSEKKKMQSGTGFFDTTQNKVVLVNPKAGTALHEYGHFSMYNAALEALELKKFGLLADSSPLARVYEYFDNIWKESGLELTETQKEETILDALNKFITTGQTQDDELTYLFNEMKTEQNKKFKELTFKRYKNLAGSMLHDTAAKKKAGKTLTKEQKMKVESGIQFFLEGYTPANQLNAAVELQNQALSPKGEQVKKDAEVTQEDFDALYELTKKNLQRYPIRDTDAKMALLETAKQNKDLLMLQGVATDTAESMKAYAYDMMLPSDENMAFATQRREEAGDDAVFFESDPMRKIEQNYHSTFNENKSIRQSIKEMSFSDLKSELGKQFMGGARYLLQSVEGAASFNKELQSTIMQEFYWAGMDTQKARETIKPIREAMDKYFDSLTDENVKQRERKQFQERFLMELANGKKGEARANATEFIKEKLGAKAAKQLEETFSLIDNATIMLKGVGIDGDLLNFDGEFWPLRVKDYDGLTQIYFKHANTYNDIDKVKRETAEEYVKKYGDDLNPQQKAKLQNLIADQIGSLFQRNTSDDTKVTSFMRRRFKEYNDPAIFEYYADPLDTVGDYLESAYRTIMMRHLIGRTMYDESGNAILDWENYKDENGANTATGKVNRILKNLKPGTYTTDAINNFKEKMSFLARRDAGTKDIFDGIRKVNQMTTLGSVFNAINQVQDLEFAITLFGADNVYKAAQEVFNGEGISLADVGAQTANEIFRIEGRGLLDRLTGKVFKWTGFEWMDVKVKETIMNASKNWFKERLNAKPDSQKYKEAMYYIDQCFPDSRSMLKDPNQSLERFIEARDNRDLARKQLIEDLKAGNVNDNTRYVQWFMLNKLQPINAATVPALYNKCGSIGKMMYQFSTVAVRQMEFMCDFYKMKAQTGGKLEAAKGFLRFAVFAAMLGLGKDVIENILKGRKTDVLNSVMFSPFHCMMINEYVVSVAKREGLFSAVAQMGTPGLGLADNITKDLWRAVTLKDYKGNTFKSVPVFGMFAYYWMFGGRDMTVKMDRQLFADSQKIKREAQNSLKWMEGKRV